jgi:hypothetical protein
MNDTSTELKSELKKSLAVLQTLREEIGVKLHLAGMDAKQAWKGLEAQLVDAERTAAGAATEATRTVLDETIKKLEKFRASLH